MGLRVETVERVRAFWREWEAGGDESAVVAIVVVAGDTCVRAPARLRSGIADVPATLDVLVAALGDDAASVRGEARLAYADDTTFRNAANHPVIEVGDADPRLAKLEEASDPQEWAEASADKPSAFRFGLVEMDALLAIATLQVWNETLGHVGVFTAASARGRGHATTVASAATERALERGLVPQWRSRMPQRVRRRRGQARIRPVGHAVVRTVARRNVTRPSIETSAREAWRQPMRRSWPSQACSRSQRFMTLPLGLRGSCSTSSTCAGTL